MPKFNIKVLITTAADDILILYLYFSEKCLYIFMTFACLVENSHENV